MWSGLAVRPGLFVWLGLLFAVKKRKKDERTTLMFVCKHKTWLLKE